MDTVRRSLALLAACLVVFLAGSVRAEPVARFTEDGALMRPQDYREWVFIGATVQPKDINYTAAYSPGIKHTYLDRASYAHWKKTGTFRTGAVIAQERVEADRREFMNAEGYFAGKHVGLQVMVKDPERFPDTIWGFFSFGKPPYPTKVWPVPGMGETDCAGCHTYVDQDWVFTRFYPMLADAAPIDQSKGKQLFERDWTPATAAYDDTGDGLGPLFHARSCDACHPDGGRGEFRFAADGRIEGQGLLLRAGRGTKGDPVYGRQIQEYAVNGVRPEGVSTVSFEIFDDPSGTVLRAPVFGLRDPAYGPLDPATRITGRVAPALFGNGELEKVPVVFLKAAADPKDADGDGISGRINRIVLPDGGSSIGRFGWKAAQGAVKTQTAVALQSDMGLSSELSGPAAGDCTPAQQDCQTAPNGERAAKRGHEIRIEDLERIAEHVAAMPPPATRGYASAGERLFADIGCAACHRPKLPLAGGGTVAAYSDLLLHDMGAGLADGLEEGTATGSEWRTAPLMGLGRLLKDGRPLLHDGRARNAHEAILWHGGEGAAAARAYRELDGGERDHLVRFLETL